MKTLFAIAIARYGKDGAVDFRFSVLASGADSLAVECAVLERLREDTPNVKFEPTHIRRVCSTSDSVHMQFCY